MTGALFVMCAATPAAAQTANETSQLLNRLNQLENQVQTMSRALYRGETPPVTIPPVGGSGGIDSTAVANFEIRMSQIEDQQRKTTGQLEKISYDIQQMKEKVTRLQADTEQRFQQQAPSPAQNLMPETSAAPSPETGGTLGTLSGNAAGGNGPAEALYEEAFSSIRNTQYDNAESKFSQFLNQYPKHPLAANARYWLGETYYVRADFKNAAKTFAQGYQDFPKSAKAADSLLKLGLSLAKLDKKEDACLSLRQLQQEFPAATGPLQRKAAQEIKALNCP